MQVTFGAEEAFDAFWTLVFMNFGLLLASVVSATQGQLSFYNAIQVQDLAW